MNKVEPNLGPALHIAGLILILIAVLLYTLGTSFWEGFIFFGGFVELLGWLIFWNDY